MKIGDRVNEAAIYADLGNLCITKDDYTNAEEFLEKALSIAKEVQDFQQEFFCHENFARAKTQQGKKQEASFCICLKVLKNLKIAEDFSKPTMK